MDNVLLVKPTGELALKSEPVRRHFERVLRANLKASFKQAGVSLERVEATRGRLFLHTAVLEEAARVAVQVFGVHEVATARVVRNATLNGITPQAAKIAREHIQAKHSFAVRCSREGTHSFSSHQVCVEAGDAIRKAVPGAHVDLEKPDKTLWGEVRGMHAYLYFNRVHGFGGLPVGVEGDIGIYVEGKEEELAAAMLLLKRGCRIHPIAEKPTAALKAHMARLLPFNAGKPLKLTPESELDALISKQRLLALARADTGTTQEDFARYQTQGEKSPLPLFYPLLFQPNSVLHNFLDKLPPKS